MTSGAGSQGGAVQLRGGEGSVGNGGTVRIAAGTGAQNGGDVNLAAGSGSSGGTISMTATALMHIGMLNVTTVIRRLYGDEGTSALRFAENKS